MTKKWKKHEQKWKEINEKKTWKKENWKNN